MSQEQEQRALALHQDSLIIDTLYQGPIGPNHFTPAMQECVTLQMQQGSADIFSLFQLRAIPIRQAISGVSQCFRDQWLASGVTGGNREIELSNYEVFADLMGLAQAQFDHLDWMIKATRAEDFRRAKAEGKAAGYISSQLVSGPFPSLEILESAWEAGLRMLQMTYNSRSTVGCGCTASENTGLTCLGRDAVRLMNQLGVIVDISHCGVRTTLDACEISTQPVVASHTMADGLFAHERGKSDEELQAIADTGGIIGVLTVPFFLGSKPNMTLNAFLDHIDYIADRVGVKYVAIGTDWPNQLPAAVMDSIFEETVKSVGFREEHGVDPAATLEGFRSYQDFPNISRGLVARGYDDDEIRGILGENFLRVFQQICG